jgi:hypothetical protein
MTVRLPAERRVSRGAASPELFILYLFLGFWQSPPVKSLNSKINGGNLRLAAQYQ